MRETGSLGRGIASVSVPLEFPRTVKIRYRTFAPQPSTEVANKGFTYFREEIPRTDREYANNHPSQSHGKGKSDASHHRL